MDGGEGFPKDKLNYSGKERGRGRNGGILILKIPQSQTPPELPFLLSLQKHFLLYLPSLKSIYSFIRASLITLLR